jgi:hypothetical protein
MIEFIVLRHQVSVVQRTKTRRPMLASDRARCGESPQIQQYPLGKFGMYARVSHILLSLLGPDILVICIRLCSISRVVGRLRGNLPTAVIGHDRRGTLAPRD